MMDHRFLKLVPEEHPQHTMAATPGSKTPATTAVTTDSGLAPAMATTTANPDPVPSTMNNLDITVNPAPNGDADDVWNILEDEDDWIEPEVRELIREQKSIFERIKQKYTALKTKQTEIAAAIEHFDVVMNESAIQVMAWVEYMAEFVYSDQISREAEAETMLVFREALNSKLSENSLLIVDAETTSDPKVLFKRIEAKYEALRKQCTEIEVAISTFNAINLLNGLRRMDWVERGAKSNPRHFVRGTDDDGVISMYKMFNSTLSRNNLLRVDEAASSDPEPTTDHGSKRRRIAEMLDETRYKIKFDAYCDAESYCSK